MSDYDTMLREKFGNLLITLEKHDSSATGMPARIDVHLERRPKKSDKGMICLDLSNYLSRLGLRFQTVPEYYGCGKNTRLRFYMTWEDINPLIENIYAALRLGRPRGIYLPCEFTTLIIQNRKETAEV